MLIAITFLGLLCPIFLNRKNTKNKYRQNAKNRFVEPFLICIRCKFKKASKKWLYKAKKHHFSEIVILWNLALQSRFNTLAH